MHAALRRAVTSPQWEALPMTTEHVQRMIQHITENCTPIDREQRFRDMLNECYSFDAVGGPFASMDPAQVLEEMDPIAFRCGVNDYCDGDTYEIEGETYDVREVDEAKEEFIDDLENEISDLEEEINEVNEDDDDEPEQLAAMIAKLEALENELDACNKATSCELSFRLTSARIANGRSVR
jgi:hypothetical protein